MLFPTNPNRRPELWGDFSEKLRSNLIQFIVRDGKHVVDREKELPFVENDGRVIDSFRAADIIRFGASRRSAIGPFLAFALTGSTARLVEYAIDKNMHSTSDSAIQEALQSVAINFDFEEKNISEIFLPFKLDGWDVGEWSMAQNEEGTLLQSCRRFFSPP